MSESLRLADIPPAGRRIVLALLEAERAASLVADTADGVAAAEMLNAHTQTPAPVGEMTGSGQGGRRRDRRSPRAS